MVLRVVAGALHRFGQEETGEAVSQFGDLPLPGADVLGIADDASVSAELLDLLLDVVDLGLDLRESMARGLGTILGLGSTTRWVLRHARSPCAGEIGKRRLSAGVGERQIPKATYSSGMLLCRYVGLGVLGRNLHVLGKLLIAVRGPEVCGGPVAAWTRGRLRRGAACRPGGTTRLSPWYGAGGAGSADLVGRRVKTSRDPWKRVSNISEKGTDRRFSACSPEEMGTFPTATSLSQNGRSIRPGSSSTSVS